MAPRRCLAAVGFSGLVVEKTGLVAYNTLMALERL